MKKFVEVSPMIVAFLIFNGFLKLYLFYGHWGIKIIDYLDFSEIILSFLNDLNIIVFCLIAFLFHQLIGIGLIDIADKKLQGKLLVPSIPADADIAQKQNVPTMILSGQPISDIVNYILTQHKNITLVICFVFTSIFTTVFFYTNNLFWLYASVASLGQFLLFFVDNTLLANEKISYEIAVLLTFLSFTCCLAIRDIKQIEKKAIDNITTITTNDESITTSSTLFLIGKTQNFIYLYNNQTDNTRIIPVGDIKSIESKALSKKNLPLPFSKN